MYIYFVAREKKSFGVKVFFSRGEIERALYELKINYLFDGPQKNESINLI